MRGRPNRSAPIDVARPVPPRAPIVLASFVLLLGCHEPDPSRSPAPPPASPVAQTSTPTIAGRVLRAGAPVAGVRVSYSGVADTAVVSDEDGSFELIVRDEAFAAAPALHVVLTDERDEHHAAVLRNGLRDRGGRIEASFELGESVAVTQRGASPDDQAWIDAHAWAEREWIEWRSAPKEDVAAHLAHWARVAATIAAEPDDYRRGLLMAAQFRIGRSDPQAGLDRSEAARAALDALGLDDPRWAIHFDSLPAAIWESGRWAELTPRLDALISEHPQPDVAGDIAVNRYIEAAAEGRTDEAAAIWQRWIERPILARTQFAPVMLSQAPTRALAPGQPLPELCVEALDGGRLCTSELRGELAVIEFWSTWCQGCRKAAAELRTAHATLAGDEAPTFVSIDIYDDADTLQAFLANEPMPWRHGWVVESERDAVQSRLQIGSIPTLVLVDADGTILASSPELRVEHLVAEVRAVRSAN